MQIHPRDFGRNATARALPTSLKELRTTYLDLVLLHYPECWGALCAGAPAPEGTWRDAWRALEAAHHAGTVRSLGVSNFDAVQFAQLLDWASVRPAVVQAMSDPLQPNHRLRDAARDAGVAFTAYSSLGTQHGGGVNPVLTAGAVVSAAAAHGVSPAQAVLRWALDGGSAVVPRSASEAHQLANRQLGFALSDAERAAIDALAG